MRVLISCQCLVLLKQGFCWGRVAAELASSRSCSTPLACFLTALQCGAQQAAQQAAERVLGASAAGQHGMQLQPR